MFDHLENILIKIAIAAVIVIAGILLAKIVKKLIVRLSQNVNDRGALSFIGSCASISIRIIFIVIALAVLGLDMSIIVGSLSAVSLGISLALRDTMNDVAGGIQILFTKPFVIGDTICIEDKEGTVTRIEILFTVLRTYDHQEIVVPNSTAISQIVVNYSKEPYRRIHITFPVSIETDPELCFQLGNDVLDSQREHILSSMQKEVVIESIQEQSMTIGIYCFVPLEDYWPCLCQMNEEVQKNRREMGLTSISPSVVVKSDAVL